MAQLKDEMYLNYRDPAKIVGELLNMSYKHDCCNFIADSIGNGLAITYGLSEKSDDKRPLNVIGFDSRGQAGYKERFGNLRAEAWWYVMKKCFDLQIAYPADSEMVREIPFASRYRMANKGLIYMLEKDKIKELLGRSPDWAEMWMMAQWGLDRVGPDVEEPTSYRDRYRDRHRVRKPQSAMA